MSKARTLANFGGTDLATQVELDAKPEYDDNPIQANLAILAIRQAADHNDVKYSLQDRIIDTYYDVSGINTGDSTNEALVSGVYRGSTGGPPTHDADATGVIGGDTWYKWTGTGAGSYTPFDGVNHDYLVIAGGGGGGGAPNNHAGNGGGGAGGYRNSYASEATGGGGSNEAAVSLVGGTIYTITVGAGGAGAPNDDGYQNGVIGGVSSIVGSDITDRTTVGGGYGNAGSGVGGTGGSGGGGGYAGAGGARTVNQGYVGGGGYTSSPYAAHGGGGAGAIGIGAPYNSEGGAGGAGLTSSIDGSATQRGGGGGGSGSMTGTGTAGAGGAGGGGAAADPGQGSAGSPNTGGGGGAGGGGPGASDGIGGAGGSGIVIIRRATPTSLVIQDLTLQSTDTVAEAEPDYADMIMLVEDAGSGVASLDPSSGNIKGWVSRDSGTTFTQGTLVDEGDWGINKRILAFHDLDISGQPTGGSGDTTKSMCYKITTHSASAVYNTKIHATSIGWR